MAPQTIPEIYAGDDVRIDFTAQYADGSAINLTSAKLWVGFAPGSVLKKNLAAGGTEAQATVVDAANGLFSAFLLQADTATWPRGDISYDAVVETNAGSRYTVAAGSLKVKVRITVIA